MGAVEHLKTLCCLGLKPESAMIAVTPLLHEIIPHGAIRMALVERDATVIRGYSDNPATSAVHRQHMWRLMEDPAGCGPLWLPSFHAAGIGWTLHLQQSRHWFDSAWYREIERPLDSCWILDSMVADGSHTIANVDLTRPRTARPFTVDDVQRLDRLRPWLAHAFHRAPLPDGRAKDQDSLAAAGGAVLSGQIVLTTDAKVVFQTASLELLLRILSGAPANYTRYVPVRDKLPAPILKLHQRIVGAANGSLCEPPRAQVSTSYGVVTLEAKWLMPADAMPGDVAKDPKSCLIAVTFELREHALAHAARVLRDSGATPAQMKVGVRLALGKAKAAIADELDLKQSTVADLAKKLYQTLDIHNSAEFARKVWLDEDRNNAHEFGFPGRPASARTTEARFTSLFAPSYKSLTQLED
jgi:DNA-binding CsgD family transcriptional regulator